MALILFNYNTQQAFFIYFLFLNLLSQLRRPSICSNNSDLIFAPKGSNIKSIPSRRANFDAETKSLSPVLDRICYSSDEVELYYFELYIFCIQLDHHSFYGI